METTTKTQFFIVFNVNLYYYSNTDLHTKAHVVSTYTQVA